MHYFWLDRLKLLLHEFLILLRELVQALNHVENFRSLYGILGSCPSFLARYRSNVFLRVGLFFKFLEIFLLELATLGRLDVEDELLVESLDASLARDIPLF